jgi:hypothetical protein
VGDLAVRASFSVSYQALPASVPGGVDPAWVFRLLGLADLPVLSLPAWEAVRGTSRGNLDQADALYGLGIALTALGRYNEASDVWRAVLPILDRCGDPRAAQLRDRLDQGPAN